MTKATNSSRDQKKVHGVHEPFTLFLYDVSYYSGKIEMVMRYKEVEFKRVELTLPQTYPVLFLNTGVMKVPAVKTAEGRWLKDSTPMIDWFDREFPESKVAPEDPAIRFVSKLVEDYADEWLWRPAMYYRWHYDHRELGRRIGREIARLPLPLFLRARMMASRQTRTFVKNDGVDKHTRDHVERTYLENLDALQAILTDSPFLLGARPTLVDFGYMGPMFRHFSIDPTPARIMRERAPAVYEWVARMWNAKASNFDQQAPLLDFSHAGWDFILTDALQTYLPSLLENFRAWNAGKKKFDYKTAQATYRNLPVVHYRVWCMEELQRLHKELTPAEKAEVSGILERRGSLDPLFSEGHVDSGLAKEFVLPLEKVDRTPAMIDRIRLVLNGTPWDMPYKVKGDENG